MHHRNKSQIPLTWPVAVDVTTARHQHIRALLAFDGAMQRNAPGEMAAAWKVAALAGEQEDRARQEAPCLN